MARSSTPSKRHKSSSSNGGGTTTPLDHTVLWVTARQPQRPSSRWTKDRPCTNIQTGPVSGGGSTPLLTITPSHHSRKIPRAYKVKPVNYSRSCSAYNSVTIVKSVLTTAFFRLLIIGVISNLNKKWKRSICDDTYIATHFLSNSRSPPFAFLTLVAMFYLDRQPSWQAALAIDLARACSTLLGLSPRYDGRMGLQP